MSEFKKRYVVLAAAVLLGFFIFADKFWGRFDTTEQDQQIDNYIEQNEEIINKVDHKMDSLMNLAKNDQLAIDSLNHLLDNSVDKDEADRLKEMIEALESNRNAYEREIVELVTVVPDTLVYNYIYQDSVIYRDTVIYNVIERDTVIYNFIDSTIVHTDTVFMSDTMQVDEKYIKNKYYKDQH